MKKYDKVLFVSHSDTCRGPMAEAILQHKLLLEDILVDSKGMIVLFPEPVNPKARDVLVQHNLELEEHEAVQFSADDFDERTLILTMEKTQKEKIQEEYGEQVRNLYTISEYSKMEDEEDIYDPHGKALEEYGHCFDVLEIIISKLTNVLLQEDEGHDSSSM